MTTRYGLLDTVDNLWMGDAKGPTLYTDLILARVAEQVVCVQLGWPLGRIRTEPYENDATKMRDEIATLCGGAEAIEALEEGRTIPRRKPLRDDGTGK